MPASASTSTESTSPRVSMPRSYRSCRSQRPSAQTAVPSAQPPGRRSNQFRSATSTRSTHRLDSKTAWLLGEASTSIRARGKAACRSDSSGVVSTASPRWSSWTIRIRRGSAIGRTGTIRRHSPMSSPPIRSTTRTRTRHRHLL